MNESKEPPFPAESGSEGKQAAASADESLSISKTAHTGGLRSYPVTDAIVDLVEENPRFMGGSATGPLIAAWSQHVSFENISLRQENAKLTEKVLKLTEDIGAERVTSGNLRAALKNEIKSRALRNVSITFGTALALWGLEAFSSANLKFAIGAAAFGVILILLGWLTGEKESEIK